MAFTIVKAPQTKKTFGGKPAFSQPTTQATQPQQGGGLLQSLLGGGLDIARLFRPATTRLFEQGVPQIPAGLTQERLTQPAQPNQQVAQQLLKRQSPEEEAAAREVGADALFGKFLGGLGKTAPAQAVGKFFTQGIPKGITKLSSLFRETGKEGAEAVIKSGKAAIPELAEGLTRGGKDIAEEVLERPLSKIGLSKGQILTKSLKETSGKVLQSTEQQVQKLVKGLPGKPTSIINFIDEAATELGKERAETAAFKKAAEALKKESNVINAKTWESVRSVKSAFDTTTGGTDTATAFKKALRGRVANKIRAEMAGKSDELASLLADESLYFRLIKQVGKAGAKDPLGRLQEILFRPELVQPVARGVKATGQILPTVAGASARLTGKSALEGLLGQ